MLNPNGKETEVQNVEQVVKEMNEVLKNTPIIDQSANNIDYLALFKQLPHCDGEKNQVDDWAYTPNLYHFDTQWHVGWIHCEEGDSLMDFMGETPEEAIKKAIEGNDIKSTDIKTISNLKKDTMRNL